MLTTACSMALLALEGATTESGIPAYVPRIVNLAIYVAILYFVLRKPMAQFFEGRSRTIRAELERATREKAEAEAKLAEVEARLAHLADEVAQIRADAEAETRAEHARVRVQAEEDARKIAETTEREIESALKAARADLQRYVAEQSVVLAESIIKTEMTDADRQRLVGEFADKLHEVRK